MSIISYTDLVDKRLDFTPFSSHVYLCLILLESMCLSAQDLSKWGTYELISTLLVVEVQHGGVPVEVRSLTTVSYCRQRVCF